MVLYSKNIIRWAALSFLLYKVIIIYLKIKRAFLPWPFTTIIINTWTFNKFISWYIIISRIDSYAFKIFIKCVAFYVYIVLIRPSPIISTTIILGVPVWGYINTTTIVFKRVISYINIFKFMIINSNAFSSASNYVVVNINTARIWHLFK